TALGGLTVWIWYPFIPRSVGDFALSRWLVENWLRVEPAFDPLVGEMVLQFVVGVVFALTIPFVSRGLTLMHWGVARGLLGAWGDPELEREVATLTESRSAAVAAEGTALR